MHLRFRTSDVVHVVLLAVSLGATSYLAYRIVGFLGIGVLGLIIGVIVLTVEIEQGGPVGHSCASNLYAQHMAAVERWKQCPSDPQAVLSGLVLHDDKVASVLTGHFVIGSTD